MPRPRFAKLPPEKRDAILDAATAAFAERGLEGASYNDIIAGAGVSKGAMYYYFDDKEDLYLTVVARQVGPLYEQFGMPEAEDPEGFWRAIEGWMVSFTAFLDDSETGLAILRDFVRVAARPGASERLAAAYGQLLALVDEMLERGREVGAIRDDLPASLTRSMLMGLGEAVDMWFLENWEQVAPGERQRLMARVMAIFRGVAMGE